MRPWWAMPGAADLWDSILLAVPKWKQSQWKRRFKMHKQWVRPVKVRPHRSFHQWAGHQSMTSLSRHAPCRFAGSVHVPQVPTRDGHA